MIMPIYCPKCAEMGRKKLLMKADASATGNLYPWCKIHGNVKVTLPVKSNTKQCQSAV